MFSERKALSQLYLKQVPGLLCDLKSPQVAQSYGDFRSQIRPKYPKNYTESRKLRRPPEELLILIVQSKTRRTLLDAAKDVASSLRHQDTSSCLATSLTKTADSFNSGRRYSGWHVFISPILWELYLLNSSSVSRSLDEVSFGLGGATVSLFSFSCSSAMSSSVEPPYMSSASSVFTDSSDHKTWWQC